MNNKKINTILYIIVFVFVFIMFITTSVAYYRKVIKKNNNVIETNNFSMLVSFDNTDKINANNLNNGYEIKKTFTIKNYSEDTIGKYSITFDIVTPLSNMVDEDFVYTLEGESESKDDTNKLISINSTPVPVMSKNIGSAIITPKNTHTYTLTIKLNNNKYASDSLFSANIKVSSDN